LPDNLQHLDRPSWSETPRTTSTPSRRLAQTIRAQDVRGEKSIAVAQGCIAFLIIALQALSPDHTSASYTLWVLTGLLLLVASAVARWCFVRSGSLPDRQLDALSIFDVAVVVALIWNLQFAYGHPAGAVLQTPSYALLVLLVGVRALRFHPRPIIVAGLAAVSGWSLLVCGAALTDGMDAVTNNYREYLATSAILPRAEAERLFVLVGLAVVLAAGALSARRMLARATHVADYGEALDAARRNLQKAEAALGKLAGRDAELSRQNTLFNAALGNMSQGLCMFDKHQRLLVCNDRYIEMYGLPKGLAKPGTHFRDIIESRIENGTYVGDDPEAYLDERLASAREAVRNTRLHELSDGRVIAISHEPLEGGGWLATHDDVTKLRRIEARLSYLSRHDPLTDLPNRAQLRERMEQILDTMRSEGQSIVVLLIEIDRFKEMNDALGASNGDALLQAIAQRMRRRIDSVDIIARIGGDEFVILQTCADAPAAADTLIKRVRRVLSTSFDIDGQTLSISASMGVAIAPVDGDAPDDLLKSADLALERAKRDGPGNARYFEREMDERMRERHRLDTDMRIALRERHFELYYQPLVDLRTGNIAGFEALLRWTNPLRGAISPAEFVPLAEETGLIVPLGEWALREACEEAARWPGRLRVAVNLSLAQFRSGHMRQSVITALGSSGLPPSRLELEITESVLMQEIDNVADVVGKLQAIGVGFALDDFGTGYSSLSYLTRLRFDRVKIDKHFISQLDDAQNSSLAVLRSVVALTDSLGIATVAEGVETRKQLEQVREEGCTEVQGFYVGRPMPAHEVPDFIRSYATGRERDALRA